VEGGYEGISPSLIMKWVRDRTGRFVQRPHYEPGELDSEAERLTRDFLVARNGAVTFPIATDDLIAMLEERTEDLDMYADLREEGESVEGMTVFGGDKPVVRISRWLTEDERRSNRLRTTLTHEFGHVHFHSCLFEAPEQPDLFRDVDGESNPRYSPVCHRDTIIDATPVDWMEWQAGYICGAILMPASEVLTHVRFSTPLRVPGRPALDSLAGQALIASVARRFEASIDAARLRLIRLGHIASQAATDQASLLS
jgi:hypothetical protein